MRASQIKADEAEKRMIAAYDRWSGWQQEHALTELERLERQIDFDAKLGLIALAVGVLAGLVWLWWMVK